LMVCAAFWSRLLYHCDFELTQFFQNALSQSTP
jgi:hypothetical protein